MTTLLAFDTATERMSIALRTDEGVHGHDAEGGARASATLLPAILALLREARVAIAELDAIAFGRGPGAFTGLRTAASVAQGLAFGAGKRVLPIDSLMAVAEDARAGASRCRVWAVTDARMDEIYAAEYEHACGIWSTRVAPILTDCAALGERWRVERPEVVAGNALTVFGARLATGDACRVAEATPNARALLAIAGPAWRAGEAVDPELALPLYVRDKVAWTSAERSASRPAVDRIAPSPTPPSEREGRDPLGPLRKP